MIDSSIYLNYKNAYIYDRMGLRRNDVMVKRYFWFLVSSVLIVLGQENDVPYWEYGMILTQTEDHQYDHCSNSLPR